MNMNLSSYLKYQLLIKKQMYNLETNNNKNYQDNIEITIKNHNNL